MTKVPSYTKVLTLGASGSERALIGNVSVQEKVDGSQFVFGLNENNEVVMRSKGMELTKDNHADMFDLAVSYILSIQEVIKTLDVDTYFYCEYLSKPKHNTLNYEKVPKNNLLLFDCLQNGRWLNREEIIRLADFIQIDVIPEFRTNQPITLEEIRGLVTTTSFLGGVEIEGVVIKNYNKNVFIGGNLYPLFTKYVTEKFKEKHEVDWTTKNPSSKRTIQDHILAFNNENRWKKAIIHTEEEGVLTKSPKDISMLLQKVQKDIEEEEKENIKEFLWKSYKKDYLQGSIKGLPEWYKEQLLLSLEGTK